MRWVPRATYLLSLAPVLTDWVDTGHLPHTPTEYVTEVVLGALIALGVWRLQGEADRMRTLALTDGLTGVGNRRAFTQDLTREVARAHRLGTALTVAYLDLNDFKAINDRLGHDAGDRMLIRTAEGLRAKSRTGVDYVYRLGGDEFAVLFTGNAAHVQREAVERLLAAEDPLDGIGVTCAVGIVSLLPGETGSDLLARADAEMYRRKRAQRDTAAEVLTARSGSPVPEP